MSDTHKTKPIDAKMKQGLVPVQEVHNHHKGPCDLPETPGWHGNADTRCYWLDAYDGKNHFCGCNLCTDHHYRREDRRRDRHNAKAAIHKADFDNM